MQQQKTSLFNLVTYALSTVTSNPVLPRWIQDIQEGGGTTARAKTPPPRKGSAHDVCIHVEPIKAGIRHRLPVAHNF